MRHSTLPVWLLAMTRCLTRTSAQTFTKCNPLSSTCPGDPALGKSTTIDFTSGSSNDFSASGPPSYDSNGANLAVAKSGDSPTITSNWYMMFGHVDVVMKPAPGVGIVSSLVLQSDDLDEIDYEWLGADNQQVQSNYFGKGQTISYNRGAFHPNPGNQDNFHTYSVDWTADQVVWQIDGVTVRAMTPATAEANQYPQTPMQLKLGIWSGGDPSNAPGTIQWAGGATNYAGGPYTMVVKSVKATDYSTGTEYTYGDMTGNWQSIKSSGGSISSGGNGADTSAMASAPSVTEVSSGAPSPFGGTHRDTSSTFSTPSVWPWVPSATTLQTVVSQTSIPGLPSGWTVSASGKVVPPSAAPSTSPPISSPSPTAASPQPSSSAAASGSEVVVEYNQQGFPVTVTKQAGWQTVPKSYDGQGFLITSAPAAEKTPVLGAAFKALNATASLNSSTSTSPPVPTFTGGVSSLNIATSFGMMCSVLVTALIL